MLPLIFVAALAHASTAVDAHRELRRSGVRALRDARESYLAPRGAGIRVSAWRSGCSSCRQRFGILLDGNATGEAHCGAWQLSANVTFASSAVPRSA